jgi:hypothetical protein
LSEKPILFSTPMVKAILAGEKTMTRRVLKPQPWLFGGEMDERREAIKLPYQVGDVLWCRETHAFVNIYGAEIGAKDFHGKQNRTILYRADGPPWRYSTDDEVPDFSDGPMGKMVPEYRELVLEPTWRPSIFMPRWASRISLKVTAVKVERVASVSEEDAKAEGVVVSWLDVDGERVHAERPPTFRQGFARLWNEINEKRGFGWNVNPWVAAITFERVK